MTQNEPKSPSMLDRVYVAGQLLGLTGSQRYGIERPFKERIHAYHDDEGSMPADVFGQLLWRFPALRAPDLFESAFGMSQTLAIGEVRKMQGQRVYAIMRYSNDWQIWSLAMILAQAIETLGSLARVDAWLAGDQSSLPISALMQLRTPIGRDLINAHMDERRVCGHLKAWDNSQS